MGGFGTAGVPESLIARICDRDIGDLHIIANNGGTFDDTTAGVGRLIIERRVRKITCSFPTSPVFGEQFLAGEIELELVPQGNLAERLRAGGSGVGGFYTPTAAGTDLASGGFPIKHTADGPIYPEPKETRLIDGRPHVLEFPLKPKFAFVKAHEADRYGNARFRLSARNFNPVAAMAAEFTIVEANTVHAEQTIAPDDVHLPGIFVNAVVAVD